jgi:hypothetical protein
MAAVGRRRRWETVCRRRLPGSCRRPLTFTFRDGRLNLVPVLWSYVVYFYGRFRMRSLRVLMPPAVVASVVAGLLACPSDIYDTELGPLSTPRPDTLAVEVARQPQAGFCLIGGENSCPGLQRFRACLASAGACTYSKQILLISSAN